MIDTELIVGNLYRLNRMWFGYKTSEQARYGTWNTEQISSGSIFTVLEVKMFATDGAVPWNTTFYVAKILTIQGQILFIKFDDETYESNLISLQ